MAIRTLEEQMRSMGVDTSATEWQFALKHIKINFPIDVDAQDYIAGYACTIGKTTLMGSTELSDRSGYLLGIQAGFIAICPSTNDFPATIYIPKKEIRIVEAEYKLFKSCVRIKLNDAIYHFKADKKVLKDIEKLINRIRNL